MIDALDPFRGRHQPGQLLGEIDPGLAASPVYYRSKKGDRCPSAFRRCRKRCRRIRGLLYASPPHRENFPIDPTLELPAIKSGVARAKRRERFGRVLVLQHGGGGYDFENRAWRKLRLNRAIE